MIDNRLEIIADLRLQSAIAAEMRAMGDVATMDRAAKYLESLSVETDSEICPNYPEQGGCGKPKGHEGSCGPAIPTIPAHKLAHLIEAAEKYIASGNNITRNALDDLVTDKEVQAWLVSQQPLPRLLRM